MFQIIAVSTLIIYAYIVSIMSWEKCLRVVIQKFLQIVSTFFIKIVTRLTVTMKNFLIA